jgi:hypothetical protein
VAQPAASVAADEERSAAATEDSAATRQSLSLRSPWCPPHPLHRRVRATKK